MEAKQYDQKVKLPSFVTEKVDYRQKVSLWWTSQVTNRQFWNGKNTQALEYLKINLDETNTVEEEILQTPQTTPPLGLLTAEDILQQYANVFRPGRGEPPGTPMHIDLDPSVTPVRTPTRRGPVVKLDRVNEELKRLCQEGIIRPVTQLTVWLSTSWLTKNQTANFASVLPQARQ